MSRRRSRTRPGRSRAGRSRGRGRAVPLLVTLFVVVALAVLVAVVVGRATGARTGSAGGPAVGLPPDEAWTVTHVIDGDTLDAADGVGRTERVRLVGIDTPERGECGYLAARTAVEELALGRRVTLTAGARDDRDRYDRLLRYVDVGGRDVGLTLVREGLAVARYDSRDGHGRHDRETAYVTADASSPHPCEDEGG